MKSERRKTTAVRKGSVDVANGYVFPITAFGAKAGNLAANTKAFKQAIAACVKAGGGTVVVPPGMWLTGRILLASNMTLHLEAGATVLFSDNSNDYPTVESRWAGTELFMYSPLIFGKDLENVTISGKGVFDGNPKKWWVDFYALVRGKPGQLATPRAKELGALNKGRYENTDCGGCGLVEQILRPPLMQLNNCRNVRLDGFTNQNSPFWNTHLVYCENVTVHDMTFRNPPGAPNGDGLDLDSCVGVRVSNCNFDVNDDCLCLKAGMNDDGHRVGKPSENITITNCTMLRGHGGVVFGSDGSGGIRNVVVSNCIFSGTERGIRLKSNRGRYSRFENLRFNNIIMENVRCPVIMNLYYTCGATERTHEIVSDPGPRPMLPSTPAIRNIHLSNITARGRMAAAGVMIGLPESPVENITFDGVEIEADDIDSPMHAAMAFHVPAMRGAGLWGRNIKRLCLRNTRISVAHGPALTITDSSEVELSGFKAETKDAGSEPMVIADSAGAK